MEKKLYAYAVKQKGVYRLLTDEVTQSRYHTKGSRKGQSYKFKNTRITASHSKETLKRESSNKNLELVLIDIAPLVNEEIISEDSIFRI